MVLLLFFKFWIMNFCSGRIHIIFRDGWAYKTGWLKRENMMFTNTNVWLWCKFMLLCGLLFTKAVIWHSERLLLKTCFRCMFLVSCLNLTPFLWMLALDTILTWLEWFLTCSSHRLMAWHSGRTSVSGRRTFPVLCSTCSWWVTTNALSHPLQVSQLGQLSLSSFRGL